VKRIVLDRDNKKVSYRKQIARQHSWSHMYKSALHLIWPQCKIWLLLPYCVHTCREFQKFGGCWSPSAWDGALPMS